MHFVWLIVWEALTYDGAWIGLEDVCTVSSDYEFFPASFLVSFECKFCDAIKKESTCLQINKVKATAQAFSDQLCRLILLLLSFSEYLSLKGALLSLSAYWVVLH